MNEYDSEVAHSGNGINTSKTAALRPIWQFAIEVPSSNLGSPTKFLKDLLTVVRSKFPFWSPSGVQTQDSGRALLGRDHATEPCRRIEPTSAYNCR
jgi:hypothetical protein